MLVLKMRREPRWVDLSDLYSGFKVRLRSLTSGDFALARDRASKAMKAFYDGAQSIADYGLDYRDATGGRLDLSDPDQILRVGHVIGSVEVAMLAITEWQGISLEDGSPAPVRREALTLLLMDEAVERRLIAEIDAVARILTDEKKDSPASPNGTATHASTGSDQNTVPDAPSQASPAPAGAPAMAGDTARNLN
jgi:hypothetical protein